MNGTGSLMNYSYSFYEQITTPATVKAARSVGYRDHGEAIKAGTTG
jgi:hypothetical protein